MIDVDTYLLSERVNRKSRWDGRTLTDFLGNNKTLAEGEWIDHKTGLLPRMLRMAKGDEPLEKFRIVEVGV